LVIPGAYPRRKHLKGAPIGLALALLTNSKTSLERVSKDKPSSLLGLLISNEEKSVLYHWHQIGPSRHSFTTSKSIVYPGEELTVTLKSFSANDDFKGFFIQVEIGLTPFLYTPARSGSYFSSQNALKIPAKFLQKAC
jgi:hypothetical protein